MRGCGGIGRRAGFKIRSQYVSEGSSPSAPTLKETQCVFSCLYPNRSRHSKNTTVYIVAMHNHTDSCTTAGMLIYVMEKYD